MSNCDWGEGQRRTTSDLPQLLENILQTFDFHDLSMDSSQSRVEISCSNFVLREIGPGARDFRLPPNFVDGCPAVCKSCPQEQLPSRSQIETLLTELSNYQWLRRQCSTNGDSNAGNCSELPALQHRSVQIKLDQSYLFCFTSSGWGKVSLPVLVVCL